MNNFIKIVNARYKVQAMQSYTYGVFPPFDLFRQAFETKLSDQFYWDLKGSQAKALERLGYGDRETWEDPEEFYKDLKHIYNKGDDTAKDVVSGVLSTMGFEWV